MRLTNIFSNPVPPEAPEPLRVRKYPIPEHMETKLYDVIKDCERDFLLCGSHTGSTRVLVSVILQLEERIENLEKALGRQ